MAILNLVDYIRHSWAENCGEVDEAMHVELITIRYRYVLDVHAFIELIFVLLCLAICILSHAFVSLFCLCEAHLRYGKRIRQICYD